MITITRYHDFSAGHVVFGHESKCANLHGHNYRVHFTCTAPGLDSIGRVIDFGVIKEQLCMWVEEYWDHKLLIWQEHPWARELELMNPEGVVILPFNPTAEEMAEYLLKVIGPQQLEGTGVTLREVIIEETRKCSAGASL